MCIRAETAMYACAYVYVLCQSRIGISPDPFGPIRSLRASCFKLMMYFCVLWWKCLSWYDPQVLIHVLTFCGFLFLFCLFSLILSFFVFSFSFVQASDRGQFSVTLCAYGNVHRVCAIYRPYARIACAHMSVFSRFYLLKGHRLD